MTNVLTEDLRRHSSGNSELIHLTVVYRSTAIKQPLWREFAVFLLNFKRCTKSTIKLTQPAMKIVENRTYLNKKVCCCREAARWFASVSSYSILQYLERSLL